MPLSPQPAAASPPWPCLGLADVHARPLAEGRVFGQFGGRACESGPKVGPLPAWALVTSAAATARCCRHLDVIVVAVSTPRCRLRGVAITMKRSTEHPARAHTHAHMHTNPHEI